MTPSTIARFGALILSSVLVLAACGAATPTPSPSASSAPSATPSTAPSASAQPNGSAAADDVDAIYDAIEAQVLELRGLPPVDVKRETIDAATLAAQTTADFDQDNPADYVAANERLYKALGLLEADQSLRQLFLDLIASQVAGFYRPDTKTLSVVSRSGEINGADKVTFAHEYDHALQDANFDVFADPEALRDQSDEALARAALTEGDATLLMSLWLIANLDPAEIQDVLAAGQDPESTAVLERTPAILTEGLLFPYNTGLAFVQPFQLDGGWEAIDALYDRLPASTEQVIHPEKYQADERPIAVELPADLATQMGEGWTEALQDTWGEFQTGVWLRESGVPADESLGAAAGWGGDRLAVLEGPDERWAVALSTVWDDEAEAAAFATSAQTAVDSLTDPATLVADGDREVVILIASDDEALTELDRILGSTGA
jgi:hypothetical protein